MRSPRRGDVIAILDSTGAVMVNYHYDAYGVLLQTGGTMATTLGTLNPLTYRGYVYDHETGLYYLQSRYYNPTIRQFISPDAIDTLTVNLQTVTNKNLFSYCDNNPVVRIDCGGQFWDTIFDVATICISVIDVCANPTDGWAWVGLACDVIDLIPFVTGIGEVARAANIANKVVDAADATYTVAKTSNRVKDTVDIAKTVYKAAPATSSIRTSTGAYKIVYKSGYSYIGKGGFGRAINSAMRNATKYGDEVSSIVWKSAPTHRDAFIQEYLMQKEFGGVRSSNSQLLTYNKIWSPGRRYFGD